MGLFQNGQNKVSAALLADMDLLRAELARVRAELAELRGGVQQAQQDVSETATRVYRHLKAVQAAARRAADGGEPNQAPVGAAPPVTPVPASPRGAMTGARARRLMRRERPDPALELAAPPKED